VPGVCLRQRRGPAGRRRLRLHDRYVLQSTCGRDRQHDVNCVSLLMLLLPGCHSPESVAAVGKRQLLLARMEVESDLMAQ